jgi:hypothetical protein
LSTKRKTPNADTIRVIALLFPQESVLEAEISGDFSRFPVRRGKKEDQKDEKAVDAVSIELLSGMDSQ